MTLLQKLEAIVVAMDDILLKSPLVQAELTALDNFLDSV